MTIVYVLKCDDNKYYVGKTTRSVNVRFQEHRDGTGSEWTRIYRPIEIVEFEKTNNKHLELNKTLDYMNEYGIDNVRGSCYSKMALSEEEKQCIRQLLSSRDDTCYKCGMTGHFASNCDKNNNNSYECFKCGSTSHLADECDDDSDDNDSSHDENVGYYDKIGENDNIYRCFKCGSPSHFADNCDEESDSSNDSYSDVDDSVECYKCGNTGHYANKCRNKSYSAVVCYKCGDTGHYANKCRN
jgi:hypothetical protein